MGKRNLALVGTHRDYLADMFDDLTGADPSTVTRCASPEDAATSYFKNVFENSNGLVRHAIVAVWPKSETTDVRQIFIMVATLTPCLEPDADANEFEVVITATPQPHL